jgi:hypothetical protein
MDLVEMGWDNVDWIGLAQDRDRWRALVNSVLKLLLPYNTGKLSSVLTTRDLSSSAQLHRVNYTLNIVENAHRHFFVAVFTYNSRMRFRQ